MPKAFSRTHTSIKADPTANASSMTIVIENTGAWDMSFMLPPTIISAAMKPVHTAMNNFPNWTAPTSDVNLIFELLSRVEVAKK